LRRERRLLLPFPSVEVRSLRLDGAAPEDPRRRAWQHVNAREQRSILQNAPTGDELAHSSRVDPSELGSQRQDRLGFRSEIEGVSGFVVIESVHAVSIVE